MDLWSELFSDSVGILSALVIAFLILMAVWFVWYFITHMMSESEMLSEPEKKNNSDPS